MADTTLSEHEQAILRLILQRKTVRGGELLSLTGLNRPEDLIGPVRTLLNHRMIEPIGLIGELTGESILFATFGVLPSAERYLRTIVQW